jgi:hypothetical protein
VERICEYAENVPIEEEGNEHPGKEMADQILASFEEEMPFIKLQRIFGQFNQIFCCLILRLIN